MPPPATRAEEAGVEINLDYYVPETGSPAWFDCWSFRPTRRNTENAHKFINYLLEPEVIAKCTNFTNYANANIAANKFVDPAVLDDPAVYPDDDSEDGCGPDAVRQEPNASTEPGARSSGSSLDARPGTESRVYVGSGRHQDMALEHRPARPWLDPPPSPSSASSA